MMGGGLMNRMLTAIGLAGLLWGCDAPSTPPAMATTAQAAAATYTEQVKIDDV